MKMNTTYELDTNGKIVSLTHNGKPVKAGYMRGLRKAQETDYWNLIRGDSKWMAQNPFSGVRMELDPLEATIYQWLRRWYARYEKGGAVMAGAPIQTYDDVKYLLLEINNEAYYNLID
jgi:hypothetical protein